MIAQANGRGDLYARLHELDAAWWASRQSREPASTYAAGTSNRMNPVPSGIDPLGSDADYHYTTERNYFLMVERGRDAVRNHALVEQGINRLIANLRLDRFTLDCNFGDEGVDAAIKAKWLAWAEDKAAGIIDFSLLPKELHAVIPARAARNRYRE